MSTTFFDSLTADLEEQDFRVRAYNGGYRETVRNLSGGPGDYIDVSVTFNFVEMIVRFFPAQRVENMHNDAIVFSSSHGELLDIDGQPTGRIVDVYYLRIELDETREGKTVGSLRMKHFTSNARIA